MRPVLEGEAPVEGLARALAVAQGQQDAAGSEGLAFEQVEEAQGDEQAHHALDEVPADGDGAGAEDLPVPALGLGPLALLETHGHHAQPQPVIGHGLQGDEVVAAAKEADAGEGPVDAVPDEQQEARQHRAGQQGLSEQGDHPPQGARQKQGPGQDGKHDDEVPDLDALEAGELGYGRVNSHRFSLFFGAL